MVQQEEQRIKKRVSSIGGISNLEELKDFSGSSAFETCGPGKAWPLQSDTCNTCNQEAVWVETVY